MDGVSKGKNLDYVIIEWSLIETANLGVGKDTNWDKTSPKVHFFSKSKAQNRYVHEIFGKKGYYEKMITYFIPIMGA